MSADLLFRARRAYVDGRFRRADIAVTDGVITSVTEPADPPPAAAAVVDVPADALLLPGLVDSHVHINDPGRAHWEGFATATAAAASAGITTLVDMPLNSLPATTSADALAAKRDAADGRIRVDVGFWGGAIPDSLDRLDELHDAGVVGFKCFLSPSGVDEFPPLDDDGLRRALATMERLGSVLVVHAEDPAHLGGDGPLGVRDRDFVESRPPGSERAAIAQVVEAVRDTGGRAHIVHLSDAGALPMIRAARAEGLPLSVETCPHYLVFRSEDVPDGATEFKCCPPIRDGANRDLLWDAVLDGTISAIVSDHSPSPIDMKRGHDGDFGLSWGGISGLQVGFAAVATEARRRGIELSRILPAFTTGPAALVGFRDRGRIAVGQTAHLTAFDPDAERTVRAAELEHRTPLTPYDGMTLRGATLATWLAGEPIDLSAAPRGRMLARS